MITRFIQKLSIGLAILVATLSFTPALVSAYDPLAEACKGVNKSESTACAGQGTTEDPVSNTVKRVTNIVAVIAGIIAVIMIIYYGFQFVTSGGDPQKAKGARSGIIYSAVGLIVIALATPLIHFIISNVG